MCFRTHRYTTNVFQDRVVRCPRTNWVHGHLSGLAGIAYYNGAHAALTGKQAPALLFRLITVSVCHWCGFSPQTEA